MNPTELQNNLGQFCGTEAYHQWSILFKKTLLTDGAKYLAEKANCFWLMDAIASHQPKCLKDKMLQDMQFWTLKVHENKSATLICERDTNDIFLKQKIPATNFPLPEIKLWVEADGNGRMIILLPSEH